MEKKYIFRYGVIGLNQSIEGGFGTSLGVWNAGHGTSATLKWKTLSTWIEYVGRSFGGGLLWNIDWWDDNRSQSAWAIRSRDRRPCIVVKSKGPWMKVSEWRIFTSRRHGTKWWREAYSSEESDGRIRWASIRLDGSAEVFSDGAW